MSTHSTRNRSHGFQVAKRRKGMISKSMPPLFWPRNSAMIFHAIIFHLLLDLHIVVNRTAQKHNIKQLQPRLKLRNMRFLVLAGQKAKQHSCKRHKNIKKISFPQSTGLLQPSAQITKELLHNLTGKTTLAHGQGVAMKVLRYMTPQKY